MASAERLKGRVAVVTGGTKGIGQGIVLRFLKEGASVVYCSRSAASDLANQSLVQAIPGASDRALFIPADVGCKADMELLIDSAMDRFGRIDIVVNNAQGIAPLMPIEDKPDGDYAMTLATGFYHSLWTSKAAFPFMKAQGYGRVINFSSHWNLHGMRFSSDYNITKAANESLTRSLANEWGKYGITVNCITPAGDSAGYKMYKDFNPAACAVVERSIPARRMGDCERDIAGAVLGLVSENGRYITGQNFCVDGGAGLWAEMTDHEIGTEIHHGHEQAVASVE